jgi:hypothetical protein
MTEQFGVAGALLVGRNRADERLGLRGEHLRGGAENLGRSFADQHVVRLDLEVGGDRLGELAGLVRIAAWPGAAFEQRTQCIQHRFPRSDRVLVAGDADDPALDGLQVRLDR